MMNLKRKKAKLTKTTSDLEEDTCKICYSEKITTVILDCGHMVACKDCGDALIKSGKGCPMCNQPIVKIIKAFKS